VKADFVEMILQPETRLRPRLIVLGVMLIPVFVVSFPPWWMRILACVVPVMLTGTYRISQVDGDKFRTQLFVGYLPMKVDKCKLPGVLYIETKFNSTGFMGDAFPLLMPLQFILMGIFDMLMPALGGPYEIWLITSKGREIVAWQGMHEQHFEQNVALLSARSGAELRARSI
jgi:hypothetical protein